MGGSVPSRLTTGSDMVKGGGVLRHPQSPSRGMSRSTKRVTMSAPGDNLHPLGDEEYPVAAMLLSTHTSQHTPQHAPPHDNTTVNHPDESFDHFPAALRPASPIGLGLRPGVRPGLGVESGLGPVVGPSDLGGRRGLGAKKHDKRSYSPPTIGVGSTIAFASNPGPPPSTAFGQVVTNQTINQSTNQSINQSIGFFDNCVSSHPLCRLLLHSLSPPSPSHIPLQPSLTSPRPPLPSPLSHSLFSHPLFFSLLSLPLVNNVTLNASNTANGSSEASKKWPLTPPPPPTTATTTTRPLPLPMAFFRWKMSMVK